MKKTTYVYTDLTKVGYTHKRMSRKNYKEMLPRRNLSRFTVVDCYFNKDRVVVQYVPNIFYKILISISLPFLILFYGIGNTREIIGDYLSVIKPRKYGSFSQDEIRRTSDSEYFEKFVSKLN